MKNKGVDITTSDTYVVLFATSQIIFYYMPIFLAFTAAKALKASQFTAVIIGGVDWMQNPTTYRLSVGGTFFPVKT